MADRITIDVDASTLFQAQRELPDAMTARLKAAAKVTADNVAREASKRVARRTGATAAAITVVESRDGTGHVVVIADDRQRIGGFLEGGTAHMKARPFLHPSARLEQGAHLRRSEDAVQEAIDSKGLGD